MLRSEQVEATWRDGGGTMLVKKDVTPAAPVRRRYGHLQATVPPQVPVARFLVVSIEWAGGVDMHPARGWRAFWDASMTRARWWS